MSAEVRAPVASSRPRFRIEGREVEQLAYDLDRLEVLVDERGLASAEWTLRNMGPGAPGEDLGLVYDKGEIVTLGDSVAIYVGDVGAEAKVFEGWVTALRASYPDHVPAMLTICAEDELQRLRMNRRTRHFADLDDAQIASTLLRDHGLRLDEGPRGEASASRWQVNRSDLATLRERAKEADALLELDGHTLRMRPRRGRDDLEPLTLRWFQDLLAFEVSADLAHQRRAVHVHGFDVAAKQGVHARASAAAIRDDSDAGRSGADLLEARGREADEHLHLEMPTDRGEAQRLADTLARQRARAFVRGQGMTAGSPTMRVGHSVEVLGVGGWFEGRYTVTALSHSWDQHVGLRTRFSVERATIGAGGPR